MKLLAKIYYYTFWFIRGVINRLSSFFYKRLMISCGKNVRFSAITSDFTYQTISIGNDVYIGPGAKFIAANSKLYIGSKVLFGPNVTIIGGDHRVTDVGRFIYDVKDKQPEDDQDIHIEDDVWVGANATILKGVAIGRGAVIAACALVNKDVKPYTIVGGVPAKSLKRRWNRDTIIKHEELLYDSHNRLETNTIEEVYEK